MGFTAQWIRFVRRKQDQLQLWLAGQVALKARIILKYKSVTLLHTGRYWGVGIQTHWIRTAGHHENLCERVHGMGNVSEENTANYKSKGRHFDG